VSREIILTKDGSHSLLHKELNETYHSVHGAIQESVHVFIDKGLRYWLDINNHQNVNILEIGFGTGLNALLSFQKGRELQVRINYATIEAYPLSKELWSRLNYVDSLGDKEIFECMHDLSWDVEHEVSNAFVLKKYYVALQDATLLPETFDVIYFDAFAPAKQPEMWTIDLLRKVTESLRVGGIFVTYCAKGQLKRDLKALGYTVETIPGPPGKKEMVRGVKAGF
jgi:tRNA U34 5-methylaminomethyl-2-thiouridine-forming methyltransferase MnmC